VKNRHEYCLALKIFPLIVKTGHSVFVFPTCFNNKEYKNYLQSRCLN